MKKNTLNILISGVGGQGVLLASEIVAETFAKAGYDVKMSAAHGMSTRGDSICSHIRIGKKIYSPLIPEGDADILIALEFLEIGRWLKYLKKNCLAILLDRQILSGIVTPEVNKHIDNLRDKIEKRCKRILKISFAETTKDLGNISSINVFLLGILSNFFSVKKGYWTKTIKEKVPHQMKSLNLIVFELGRKNFGIIKKKGRPFD